MRLTTNVIQLAVMVLFICCFAAPLSHAQSKKDASHIELYSALPPPLEDTDGNMLDFEKNGHLEIEAVKFRKVGHDNKDALVWTLKVNKPITYQHVITILKDFRDVRFYLERPENKDKGFSAVTRELHFTRLDYDLYIRTGAANSRMLALDDTFDIWIYMDKLEARKLKAKHANRVVFSNAGRFEELRKRRFSKSRASAAKSARP